MFTLFEDELNLKLTFPYRQDSCHLECQMREVEHQCHCSPWEYPSINTSLPICNGFDKCTQDVLSDTNIEDQCYKNCPVDCTLVRYSKVATSNPINFERICKNVFVRSLIVLSKINLKCA